MRFGFLYRYEILGKFFDALDSSILLSKLRGSKPTFLNISRKIEHLTERYCFRFESLMVSDLSNKTIWFLSLYALYV